MKKGLSVFALAALLFGVGAVADSNHEVQAKSHSKGGSVKRAKATPVRRAVVRPVARKAVARPVARRVVAKPVARKTTTRPVVRKTTPTVRKTTTRPVVRKTTPTVRKTATRSVVRKTTPTTRKTATKSVVRKTTPTVKTAVARKATTAKKGTKTAVVNKATAAKKGTKTAVARKATTAKKGTKTAVANKAATAKKGTKTAANKATTAKKGTKTAVARKVTVAKKGTKTVAASKAKAAKKGTKTAATSKAKAAKKGTKIPTIGMNGINSPLIRKEAEIAAKATEATVKTIINVKKHFTNEKGKFRLPLHGNYCGPGHGNLTKNPKPVDTLDAICRKHDIGYKKNGYFSRKANDKFISGVINNFDKMKPAEKVKAVTFATGFAVMNFTPLREVSRYIGGSK